MKQIKGQLSIFDLFPKTEVIETDDDEKRYTIAEFDKRFRVGDRLFSVSNSILEITDIRLGELSARIRNVTLEDRGKYVGERYYINKESFGLFYADTIENMQKCKYYGG